MFIHTDFIDKKICKDLINLFETSKERHEYVNDGITKMTQLIYEDTDYSLETYVNELHKIVSKYKKKYNYIDQGQEPWNIFKDVKIQKYQPHESYFTWHSESTGIQNTHKRILVFTTYLNNVEDKGETEFLYQQTKIKPKEGKTILFPPFWTHTHRGNPSKDIKYIITGWYTYVY